MTPGLFEGLADICTGKTAFVGIGNCDRGDDGAGMALAHALQSRGVAHVFEGGTTPEKLLRDIRQGNNEFYAAGSGYDPASGLGVLDVAAFAAAIR